MADVPIVHPEVADTYESGDQVTVQIVIWDSVVRENARGGHRGSVDSRFQRDGLEVLFSQSMKIDNSVFLIFVFDKPPQQHFSS